MHLNARVIEAVVSSARVSFSKDVVTVEMDPGSAVVDPFKTTERIEVVLFIEDELLGLAMPHQVLEISLSSVSKVWTELYRVRKDLLF